MKKLNDPATIDRQQDRYSWLWLAIGAALLPFANIQTIWPLAAWLAPVFLIRFSRTQRPSIGLPLIALVGCIAVAIATRDDYTTLPVGLPLASAVLGYALLYLLPPFVLDRLLAPRLSGALRTLVYPLAAVAVTYLMLLTPFHTLGTAAYTQYGDLALMQLVSLTGIWGLTFLVSWLGPVVDEVWERGASPGVLRSSFLPFVLVLAGVLLYGSARLMLTPAAPTVRVAGLTPDRTLFRYPSVAEVARSGDAERVALRPTLMAIVDDLLARSRQEARAGAKIVAWSETAAIIFKEDEPTVLAQARSVARDEGVYLQLGLMAIRRTDQFPFGDNRAILIDPTGNVVWDYHKAFPVPFNDALEVAPGPAVIPFTDTPYGRLAGVICYDLDWVPYARQAGLAQAGLLLAGADDWPAIENDHAHAAVFRAVENGFSLLRPAGKGLSLAVDPLGRELASGDYFATDRLDTVAMVPVQAVPTLYSRIGDVFAWLSISGLVALVGRAVVGQSKAASAPAAGPKGAPLPAA